MRHPTPIDEIRRRVNENWDKLSTSQRRTYLLILAGKCVECGHQAVIDQRRCEGCESRNSARVIRHLDKKKQRSKANV